KIPGRAGLDLRAELAQDLDVVDLGSREAVHHDEGPGVGLTEDVLDLERLVAAVSGHGGSAELGAAEGGDVPLHPVRHTEDDVVARLDAEAEQAPGEGVGPLLERAIGDALVSEDDGFSLREALGRPIEELPESQCGPETEITH